jgi:hypothetical protein
MRAASSERGTGRRAAVLALFTFVAAALLATYPLLRHPTHTIAGGLGDPIILTTVLAWDADRLWHGLHGLWDPPFLYPHHWTLAYSEHMLGVAIFTAPVEWLFGNPVLTYNVAYIGSYVLAGFGMFLLTRTLWGRADAAMLAGLAFALTPYRLAHTTHLQVLMNGWMPIGLLALHRYFASGSRRWLAAFAAAYLLTGLSNGYYLYFFLLPIGVVIGVELLRPRMPRQRILGEMAFASLAIGAALAPIVYVYFRLQRDMGFTRDPSMLRGLSARLPDYFRIAVGAWNWGGLLPSGAGERQLFHGFTVIVFAVVGGCTIAARDRDVTPVGGWRRIVITYGLIAALAVLLSMGPGPWRPYLWLFSVVPGFSGMRVPARFASIVIVALAVLAGAGFAWLFDRLPRRVAAAAALAFVAVIVLEGQHGISVTEVPGWRENTWDRVAYSWLRDSPPGGVLELDITELNYFRTATTMFQLHALEHRHPIVNGYSGWSTELQELLGARTSPLREPGRLPEVVRGLRRVGVRYVLLHQATFVEQEQELMRQIVAEMQDAHDQIAEAHEWQGTWAWRLKDIDPRPPAPAGLTLLDPKAFELRASHQAARLPLIFDGNLDTRWMTGERQAGTEWVEVRLPRPADLRRLEMVGAGRTLLDYPQHLSIDSTDPAGASQSLFDDGVVDRYVESVAFNDLHPSITLKLPRNQTVMLRIGQTGRGASWWSIHELKLWEQKEAR